MAKAKTYSTESPWENRWVTPTTDDLMAGLNEQQVKLINGLIDRVMELGDLDMELEWYGVSWKWSFQLIMPDLEGQPDERDKLLYFVPNPEAPTICIPLTDDMIESMPLKRLNRYVRDGVKHGKQAVNIHWAVFTPSAQTEIDHLFDLIKRKHKFLTAG